MQSTTFCVRHIAAGTIPDTKIVHGTVPGFPSGVDTLSGIQCWSTYSSSREDSARGQSRALSPPWELSLKLFDSIEGLLFYGDPGFAKNRRADAARGRTLGVPGRRLRPSASRRRSRTAIRFTRARHRFTFASTSITTELSITSLFGSSRGICAAAQSQMAPISMPPPPTWHF
jgi:hypothetical protein